MKLFSHLDRIHYFFFSQVNIPLCTSPSLSLTWKNSCHFVPPLVSLQNDIAETSTEITTQIWVVLLIGWKFASSNQEHYLDWVSDTSSVWSFCPHFSDVISWGDHRWRHKMSPVFSGYYLLLLTFTCIMGCFCIDIPESDCCITWTTRQISTCMTVQHLTFCTVIILL